MGKVSKGTSSYGKRAHKTVHIKCRRCGKRSYNIHQKQCSACGYGKTTKLKRFSWQTKTLNGARLI